MTTEKTRKVLLLELSKAAEEIAEGAEDEREDILLSEIEEIAEALEHTQATSRTRYTFEEQVSGAIRATERLRANRLEVAVGRADIRSSFETALQNYVYAAAMLSRYEDVTAAVEAFKEAEKAVHDVTGRTRGFHLRPPSLEGVPPQNA